MRGQASVGCQHWFRRSIGRRVITAEGRSLEQKEGPRVK